MDRLEYEYLQEALRRKLHRENGYLSENKEDIYRDGIRTAMSIISNHQNVIVTRPNTILIGRCEG